MVKEVDFAARRPLAACNLISLWPVEWLNTSTVWKSCSVVHLHELLLLLWRCLSLSLTHFPHFHPHDFEFFLARKKIILMKDEPVVRVQRRNITISLQVLTANIDCPVVLTLIYFLFNLHMNYSYQCLSVLLLHFCSTHHLNIKLIFSFMPADGIYF